MDYLTYALFMWRRVEIERNGHTLWKSMGIYIPGLSHGMGFAAFSRAMRNSLKKSCISHAIEHTTGWKSNERELPILWEKIGKQHPGCSHRMCFAVFPDVMGYWWETSCIFHVMKYTIGQESDEKEAPTLWEKYGYQFPRLFPQDGFCCLFRCYGILMRRPRHFSCKL